MKNKRKFEEVKPAPKVEVEEKEIAEEDSEVSSPILMIKTTLLDFFTAHF